MIHLAHFTSFRLIMPNLLTNLVCSVSFCFIIPSSSCSDKLSACCLILVCVASHKVCIANLVCFA